MPALRPPITANRTQIAASNNAQECVAASSADGAAHRSGAEAQVGESSARAALEALAALLSHHRDILWSHALPNM